MNVNPSSPNINMGTYTTLIENQGENQTRPLADEVEVSKVRRKELLSYYKTFDHTTRDDVQELVQNYLEPRLKYHLEKWHNEIRDLKRNIKSKYCFEIHFYNSDYDPPDTINFQELIKTQNFLYVPSQYWDDANRFGLSNQITWKVREAIWICTRNFANNYLQNYNPEWAEGYEIKYNVSRWKCEIKFWLEDPNQSCIIV